MSAIHKMYVIEAGRIIVPDNDPMAKYHTETFKYTIPVPVVLLEHETEGLILLDAGIHPDRFPAEQVKRLVFTEKAEIDKQLQLIGYTPEDVKHVIMSHWHRDHHGQLFLFKNATMHIREEEMLGLQNNPKQGYPPGEVEAYERYRRECPDATVAFIPQVDMYDVFGDGSLITIDSKGHTPGQQSFLVELKKSGKWLFATDAIHDESFLNPEMEVQRAWNSEEFKASVIRLKQIADAKDAKLIFGHDSKQWETLKLVPEYYE